MKPINKDELFQHLSGFLKEKGVELKKGSYAQGVEKSCGLLADAVNLGQKGFGKAKVELEKGIGQVRQFIHEQTAPKPAAASKKPTRKAPAKKPLNRAAKKSRKP
jgi:hypothetical protein